ncbi:MAG: hypothetical protein ACOCX4_03915 [Planctomycetota bacterium]
MRPLACLLCALALAAGSLGCTIRHEVDAHIQLDINLRVQRELEDFFGSIEQEVKADMSDAPDQAGE